MGGYDVDDSESHLYYIDYLAAQVPVDYYAFGYGGMFTLSVMDKEYRRGTVLISFMNIILMLTLLC